MPDTPSKEDVFGTYLEGVSGLTVVNKILHVLNNVQRMPLSALAAELGAMPEEIVSAVLQAERGGFVKLEKTGDETIVTLISRPHVA